MRKVIIYGDELYHYGVMGMKWGHHSSSRYYESKGYTKKDYKESVKLHKKLTQGENHTNRQKVANKIDAESRQTPTGKKFTAMQKKYGVSGDAFPYKDHSIKLTDNEARVFWDHLSEKSAIGHKYMDDMRGAALKDLGYKNTKKARDYLKRMEDLEVSDSDYKY